MKVAIIGGGIAGLTTALALKKSNVPFTLYEAASHIKEVGAGIIIANNALQVFRHLGIHQQIYKKGHQVNALNITKADFSTLSSITLTGFEQKYGLQNHAIHRADLYEIIATAVGKEHIEINKRLTYIKRSGEGYQLFFEDGTSVQSNHIIGADGIRSQVRQQLFSENKYRDPEQVCWRGVVDITLPPDFKHQALEAWGKGKRIGFVQISEHKVYWYIVINTAFETGNHDLCSYLKNFHPLAIAMVKATAKKNIIKGHLLDLKPVQIWYKNNVCLVGDAAHATTPNLGQGACQAIEDAFILGELTKKYDLTKAFEMFPEIRRKKAHDIVNTSWNLGILAHLTNPVAIAFRNVLMKYLTPKSVNLKQLEKIFTLPEVD